MKIKISFLLSFTMATLWGGVVSADAASSDVSEPVGALQVALLGASDTTIGLPLERNPVFEGRIASATSDTLTIVEAPGWTTDYWISGTASFYLLVLTGAEEGMALRIVGNDSNSITVDLGGESLAAIASDALHGVGMGDQIRIHPFTTPSSIFGGHNLADQTILYLYDPYEPGVNKSPSETLTYTSGLGWYDSALAQADDFPIERGSFLKARLPLNAPDLDLWLTGHVPMTADRKRIPRGTGQQDFQFSIVDPEGVAVGDSGLALVDRATVFVYNNSRVDYNKSPSQTLTYFDGWGWFGNQFEVVDHIILEPGVGYVLRLPAAETPMEYIISRVPEYLED